MPPRRLLTPLPHTISESTAGGGVLSFRCGACQAVSSLPVAYLGRTIHCPVCAVQQVVIESSSRSSSSELRPPPSVLGALATIEAPSAPAAPPAVGSRSTPQVGTRSSSQFNAPTASGTVRSVGGTTRHARTKTPRPPTTGPIPAIAPAQELASTSTPLSEPLLHPTPLPGIQTQLPRSIPGWYLPAIIGLVVVCLVLGVTAAFIAHSSTRMAASLSQTEAERTLAVRTAHNADEEVKRLQIRLQAMQADLEQLRSGLGKTPGDQTPAAVAPPALPMPEAQPATQP